MLVDPFRFGVGVGIIGTIGFELLVLVMFIVHSLKNKRKFEEKKEE